MNRFTRTVVVVFVLFSLTAANGEGRHPNVKGVEAMKATGNSDDGAHDFDFWMGLWNAHNRRLRERLKGSTTWDEFEATCVAHPLAGDLGNEDEYRTDFAGGFVGMTFRFYNPAAKQWAIYWADNRRGLLDPPVVGSFAGDTGIFEGPDTFEGRPIRVRFTWVRINTAAARWEQTFSEDGGKTWETNWVMDMTRVDPSDRVRATDHVEHLKDFPVVEFRRYTIKGGERAPFARMFEAFFPEAFQQIGAIAFGQFLERGNPNGFTWIRGFKSIEARGIGNAAFYYGPLWKEHASAMNERMVDSDNVLLLRPLSPERGIPVLPAVDPVSEEAGVHGVVVAEIFPVKAGSIDAFAERTEATFASYRAAGVREVGVLVTLDGRNTFPQHPVRMDGPYLVWLGIAENDRILETRFTPLFERSLKSPSAEGLLRGKPELVVLDPTSRSRLRWLPER